MKDALRHWVADVTGCDVTDATPVGSGASRRIWRVGLGDGRSLVVREDTGDGPVAGTPLDLAREAAVYGALTGSGLPVPALHAVNPDGTALLLEYAAGSAEEPAAAGPDYLRCLGELHLLDVATLDLGPLSVPADGPAHALDDLSLWRSIADSRSGSFATPAVAAATEWLAAHVPPEPSGTALCHGDAGPGNFLHDGGRVTAMLDWEFAHVGDPHDDLAWVAVRNQLLGSPIDVGAAYDAWRAATGWSIDRSLVEYYRVLVLVRMLISCDATMNWSAGVEHDGNRTQSLLRPLLAHLVCDAVRAAGGDGLEAVEDDARAAWLASPLRELAGDALSLADLAELV